MRWRKGFDEKSWMREQRPDFQSLLVEEAGFFFAISEYSVRIA